MVEKEKILSFFQAELNEPNDDENSDGYARLFIYKFPIFSTVYSKKFQFPKLFVIFAFKILAKFIMTTESSLKNERT